MKDFNLENDEILIYYMLALLILKDITKKETIQTGLDDFLDKVKNIDKELLDPNGMMNDLKALILDTINSLKQLDDPPPMFLNMYDFLNDFLNFSRGKKLVNAFEELGLKPERLKELFGELSLDVVDERVKVFFDLFDISDRYEELVKWLSG